MLHTLKVATVLAGLGAPQELQLAPPPSFVRQAESTTTTNNLIESVAKRVRQDIIHLSELPINERRNSVILAAAFKSQRSSDYAMSTLQPCDLNDPILRPIIFSNLERSILGGSKEFATAALADDAMKEAVALHFFVKPQRIDAIGRQLLERCDPDLAKDYRSLMRKVIHHRLTNALPIQLPSHHGSLIFAQDREISLLALDRVLKDASAKDSNKLRFCNLSPEEVAQGVRHGISVGTLKGEAKFEAAPNSMLMTELKYEYRPALLAGSPGAFQRLDSKLAAVSEFYEAALEGGVAHPEVVGKLKEASPADGSDKRAELYRTIIRRIANNPVALQGITTSIGTDITNIKNYPAEILRIPRVAHSIRQTIQLHLKRGIPQEINQGTLLTELNQAIKIFPELLKLHHLAPVGSARNLPDPAWYTYNPRAITYFPERGSIARRLHTIDQELPSTATLQATNKAIQAGALFDIQEFRRFDNAREILRNRYLVASPEIKAALEEILGADYFAGTHLDGRPIAVIVFPRSDADKEGAFNSNYMMTWNSGTVDKLTSYYQVFYFEVGTGADAIRAPHSVANATNEKVSLYYIAGHGNGVSIKLGQDDRFTTTGYQSIDNLDLDELRFLTQYIEDGGTIVLGSCSAAAEINGMPSVASVIHAALPQAHLFASSTDCTTILTLDDEGKFLDLGALKGQNAHFTPQDEIVREGKLASTYRYIIEKVGGVLETVWNDLAFRAWRHPMPTIRFYLICIGIGSVVGGAYNTLYQLAKPIMNLISRKTKPEEQTELILFDDPGEPV